MSTVDTWHTEYGRDYADWQRIEDITRMRNLERYLITLNPQDTSVDNETRNQQYKERAQFYAVAAQTVQGLLGTMFAKDPVLHVPPILEYVARNVDGANTSLYQQSQGAADDVIRKSRAGLYVSFPATEGAVSRKDLVEGRVAATIHRYAPEQIINWRVSTEDARTRLRLVVLEEYKEKEDRYSVEKYRFLRELYLEDGVYKERHWSDLEGNLEVVEEMTPTDSTGQTWTEIPFIFVGAENNDETVDRPVMLPLVELNIGHYRNSADWEDSVWYGGQPQPYMTGLTQEHVEMMQENGMYVGSRQILGVPEGGSFGFAAPPPNPLVRQAMMDKVEMMLALGARLVQPGSAPRTATEAAGMREAQHSVLSLIAANLSEAYTQCLQWAGRYMGLPDSEDMTDIGYALNQDYVGVDPNPQELQAMMMGWVQGSVPLADYVGYMQRRGLFDQEKGAEDYSEDLERRGNDTFPTD